ncbi:SDR family NAD(P)-dependent oxidoreductase [Candidatus Obscuribacterales bacterium]|jgi:dihydroflavonol-4-reductase|nr:SDR family NAD(P)-dependent oxidoreductase [Candidatus Obscuribacterales bacterium]
MSEEKEASTNKKVLVTGASGFIGSNLVQRLVDEGYQVKTFGRSGTASKKLRDLPIEHLSGDVTNLESIHRAMDDIDVVFHLAGLVSYKKKDVHRQYAVNVVGTRNVLEAALRAGVGRVIHTSSVAAMGIPKSGEIGTEELEYNLGGLGLNYCDSKYAAEQEVKQIFKRGLPVITLSPGITFGEGDKHPHHHAIFTALAKGALVGVPKGGVTFSDINDVVDAHIAAIDKGTPGERYALVSANLSYRQAAEIFSKVQGVRPPMFEIPASILVGLGTLAEAVMPMFGMQSPVSRQAAWLAQHKIFFSSDKAMRELDFKPTPFEDTIRRVSPYYLYQKTKK